MMTVDAAFDRIGSALRQRGYTFVREEKPRDASGDRSAVFKSPAMSVQVGWKGKARLMTLEVDSDSARFTLSIENIPSEKPKTGKNVALSVIAALRKMHAPLAVGT